jgi:outer membrane protein insertion porin family
LGHPIPSEIAVREKPAPYQQSGLFIFDAALRSAFLCFATRIFFPRETTPRPLQSSVHSSSSVQGEMIVTCLKIAICIATLLLSATPALPQIYGLPAEPSSGPPKAEETPILVELRFTGLRRIASAAVAAQIASHPGERLDPEKIEKDLRRVARLGWFASIEVEEAPSTAPFPRLPEDSKRVTLIFHVHEFPFLSRVEYSGSRLLSQKQIEKMLEDKKLEPGLGKPADPAALHRIAIAIRAGLNELGHPEASVRITREEASNSTVTVRFEINDGPLLRARRVSFDGHPQVSTKLLREQMRRIAPWKPLASWRGKNAFTREGFEEDRQRLLAYYQNQGFPEARIGNARVVRSSEPSRQWLPWPHETTMEGLAVSIPVEAGPFYRFESIAATDALRQAAKDRGRLPANLHELDEGGPFSQLEIDKLRRLWVARIQSRNSALDSSYFLDVMRTFNPENHTARVAFDLGDSPPYLVQRIEFLGLHKFSDRYVRRRIPLREGHPVDERALEAGLLRLARTGYFKPIHKEDIRVQLDEATHTANVLIHLEEVGQQRACLAGGTGQFGSTLGIVYTVFDLLNREELLSAQLDGGPEGLQIMLSLAKEAIFGTRASLAFSVFNTVIRPRFASTAQGPFFSSHSEGINIPWTYPLTNTDTLGINYTLSRATTEYLPVSPSNVLGVTLENVRSNVSSRSLGVGWARDTGIERVQLANSASGGWLGGGENMVRSSAECGRIFRDPFFAPTGAWAFRTTFSGAGSYRGDMPFYARFFSGDELVRGLRPGELGPYAVTARIAPSGTTIYSASPAGANLAAASSAEYRFPLAGGTEAAAFFDLGSGLLLPNWLGPTKPVLLGATNGVLHGSTGIEFRWTVPGVQVPVRAYYALNVLRVNRFLSLSENSLFHAHNRFSAFGWGLGSLF